MTEQELNALRYPIGKFNSLVEVTDELIQTWITSIEELPMKLRALVTDFSDEQLATPYRPDGWTVRQTISTVLFFNDIQAKKKRFICDILCSNWYYY